MQRKLVVLFCLVLLAFAGLSVRLILINRDNGDSYKKQVLSQQQYSSTTIPYKRGEILDSKGTKLASSEKVYDLVLDIKQMNNKEDYVEPTIQALEDYFSIDDDQVRAYAQEHPDSQYYVLKKRMSYNEISDYQQMMADTSQKEYNQYVKGIWFEESYKRVYPNSSPRKRCHRLYADGRNRNLRTGRVLQRCFERRKRQTVWIYRRGR